MIDQQQEQDDWPTMGRVIADLPQRGPIVLFLLLIDHKAAYVLAILIGALLTAGLILLLRVRAHGAGGSRSEEAA